MEFIRFQTFTKVLERIERIMQIFTIGFTGKSAQQFFNLIKEAEVSTIFDVRANNTSQLSGFAKKQDLTFFLKEILNVRYLELQDLAPDRTLLKKYRSKEVSWEQYSEEYCSMLSRRNIEKALSPSQLVSGCLLCSEDKPHHCHRRLAGEYLLNHWNDGSRIKLAHLV